MPSTKFKSAIDKWVYWMIIFIPLVVLVSFGSLLLTGPIDIFTILLMLVTCLVSIVLPLWSLNTYYEFTESDLIIQSGPFHWKIPLGKIENAKRTRSSISGPALSLNRIQIEHSKGEKVLISPKDMDSFLQILNQRTSLSTP